jgi:chromosome segregation ATPase
MKMLKAANVCTLEDVEPLSQEYRAINDVLNQLVAMEKSLSQRRDVLQQCTDDLSSEISDLQTKYETAESRVNVITELNE